MRLFLFLSLALCVNACQGAGEADIAKIALLAPFEGQYREIGYNAFYALRLAYDDVLPQRACSCSRSTMAELWRRR